MWLVEFGGRETGSPVSAAWILGITVLGWVRQRSEGAERAAMVPLDRTIQGLVYKPQRPRRRF